MSKSDAGKGDCPRPMEVDYEEFTRRWMEAFNDKVSKLMKGDNSGQEKDQEAKE